MMSFIARGLNVMINIGKGVVTVLDNYIAGMVGFQVALFLSWLDLYSMILDKCWDLSIFRGYCGL
jgi:hypothetical protein